MCVFVRTAPAAPMQVIIFQYSSSTRFFRIKIMFHSKLILRERNVPRKRQQRHQREQLLHTFAVLDINCTALELERSNDFHLHVQRVSLGTLFFPTRTCVGLLFQWKNKIFLKQDTMPVVCGVECMWWDKTRRNENRSDGEKLLGFNLFMDGFSKSLGLGVAAHDQSVQSIQNIYAFFRERVCPRKTTPRKWIWSEWCLLLKRNQTNKMQRGEVHRTVRKQLGSKTKWNVNTRNDGRYARTFARQKKTNTKLINWVSIWAISLTLINERPFRLINLIQFLVNALCECRPYVACVRARVSSDHMPEANRKFFIFLFEFKNLTVFIKREWANKTYMRQKWNCGIESAVATANAINKINENKIKIKIKIESIEFGHKLIFRIFFSLSFSSICRFFLFC